MKLETFFEKFDQFADAPDAVAKMRELVLELAVQGKLVEQNHAEGDGSALLRQIQERNPSSLAEADAEPVDSELASMPSSWATSKLGEVAQIIRGITFPGSAKSEARSHSDVVCLRTASVQTEIDWDDLIYISPTYVSREDQWVTPDDIVISMANSYALVGKVAIVRTVPQKATFGAFLAVIRPVLIEPYFLLYVLRSPRMQAAFRTSSSQTTNIANISLGRMRPLPFPLPPLAEQKRIVAKVDELMALCDRLEAQQQERETRHAALARASLARFADAPTPANLPLLFHPSYDIPPPDLRKSILTLAVQGKLVAQDPNDEPASELLERLARELTPEQRCRQAAPLTSLTAESLPYEIPHGWKWARFRDVAIIASNLVKPDDFLDFTHLAPDNIEKGNGVLLSCRTVREDKVISSNHRFYPGQIVYSKIRPNLAKVVVVDFEGLCSADMYPINALIDSSYLHRYMLAEPFLSQAVKTDTRVAMPKINQMELNAISVPIPPLAEQRRIVVKVEQLMALVDQLEEQLFAAAKKSAVLLEAAIYELLNPSTETIQSPTAVTGPLPDRAAIGCYTIQKLADRSTFGRTAQVKVLYLAEAHIGLELGGQYFRDAAGPLDQWIYAFEKQAAEQKWFSVVEKLTDDHHKKIDYRKGPNLSAKAGEAKSLLPPEFRKEFDRLLTLLANKPTVEVEIIATLFAAWNDSLIDGYTPSDAEIIRDVRENWHPSKQRFNEAELKRWLDWMRQQSLVPKGRGPHTRGSQVALRLH